MPATYEPIATTTLSSAAASITFSSISASYTDLRLVLVATTSGASAVQLVFNGNDNTGSYSRTYLLGDGSTASSARGTSQDTFPCGGQIGSTPEMHTFDIFNYAGSTNKTFLFQSSEDNNGSGLVIRSVGLWRNTAAITNIKLQMASGSVNFATGTTATLYGILKA